MNDLVNFQYNMPIILKLSIRYVIKYVKRYHNYVAIISKIWIASSRNTGNTLKSKEDCLLITMSPILKLDIIINFVQNLTDFI